MIDYYKDVLTKSFDGEHWKDIPGWENIYQASDFGRIRSIDIPSWNGVAYFIKKGRILKQQYTGRNRQYLCTGLSISGKTKRYYVHRLIASTFISNPDNKPQVNHIDGIGVNNKVANLEWNTNSENHRHAYIRLKRKSNLLSKFTGLNIVSKKVICKNLSGDIIHVFESCNIAGEKLGFPQQSISRHCLNKKPYKNFIFQYDNNR